ncbi:hypothetical protein L5515_003283 [Caenorhabditis briggsae]|uniref:Uncharacterized protein n=1 Tax=Caenorhabditis briggsae TaxID=6238 RepID=A0AAE9EEE8_CAEBR|nr:hypothetical protein L5515_003283 [Caenorhabditis briggsae]
MLDYPLTHPTTSGSRYSPILATSSGSTSGSNSDEDTLEKGQKGNYRLIRKRISEEDEENCSEGVENSNTVLLMADTVTVSVFYIYKKFKKRNKNQIERLGVEPGSPRSKSNALVDCATAQHVRAGGGGRIGEWVVVGAA